MTTPARHDDPAGAGLDRRRVWAFVALCVCAVLLAAGYAALVIARRSRPVLSPTVLAVRTAPPPRPYLVVSSTAPGDTWQRLVLVSADAPRAGRFVTPFSCERAHVAGGHGVCMRQDVATAAYGLEIFDDTFTLRHRVPLTGVPSRARVSPDGRWASVTVFEHGHSYAEEGFSTRTTLVDTSRGQVVADLEQFRVERDGKRFSARDFNFWGVTFAPDSNRFYATLASGGVNYLIEGHVDRRTARVLRTGVECPSASPDGTQIAYKHLVRRGQWELRILDLQRGTERVLSHETRSVDDQVDWLDADHVIYQMVGNGGANIWSLKTSGEAAPVLLVDHAFSPSVVH